MKRRGKEEKEEEEIIEKEVVYKSDDAMHREISI